VASTLPIERKGAEFRLVQVTLRDAERLEAGLTRAASLPLSTEERTADRGRRAD
jgi:hypothetical protein